MVKPSGADRDIALGGVPDPLAIALNHGGFILPGHARLVANPADVRAGDGDEGAGLQLADQGVITWEVVFLLLSVRPLAAGAVEPDLVDGSVSGQEFAKLVPEELVVFGGVPVGWLIPIPGGEVEADTDVLLSQGIDDFPDDISFAIPPGGVFDTVPGELGWPEAESIMVLGCEDEQFHSGILEHFGPLVGVKISGVEEFGILPPVTPFAVGKGVHAEVGKRDEFMALPFKLSLGGDRRGKVCGGCACPCLWHEAGHSQDGEEIESPNGPVRRSIMGCESLCKLKRFHVDNPVCFIEWLIWRARVPESRGLRSSG